MKGRMFVVNSDTLTSTTTSLIASIFTPKPTGEKWLSTISDIMADMLQIEIGDYIFLWETSSESQKSRIHGVYRAISKPYYECTSTKDNAPFKIHIEKAYNFENPIDEYDVLNCPYIKSSMWTIVGKKVKGKSRGTSPLSQEEVKHLITLLIGKNPNYSFIKFNEERCVDVTNALNIDYSKKGKNTKPKGLATMHPNKLFFFNESGNVYYEKTIETILNQEMTDRNKTLFEQLGIDVDKVIWYSNYLPYSIEQSEMDYVIIESDDGFTATKIYLLELMMPQIDESHIKRTLMYSKWLNDTLALGTNFVQPILIAGECYDFINGETDGRKINAFKDRKTIIEETEAKYGLHPMKIYQYDFSGSSPTFIRKR